MKRILLFFVFILSVSVSEATVVLPGLITDNMVLQQNSKVALWGKTEPKTRVEVVTSWDEKKVTAVSDKEGNWKVFVQTPSAGGPYRITFDDGDMTSVENVLIGEVWLCAGQSNMNMPMTGSKSQPVEGSMEYIVGAKPSRPIRICWVKRAIGFQEASSCKAEWQEHTNEAVAKASAVGYFFANKLQETLDVPVGIIIASWGGSTIEAWMSRELLESKFSSEVDLSVLDSGVKPKKPQQTPAMLYNGMLGPLKNFGIKGVVWYQGCSNVGAAELYSRLQPEFVKMLRKMWNNNELPYYYVQIAPYRYKGADKIDAALLREAQMKNLSDIPFSGMVVSMDCGDELCIHPARKKPLGDRLAYLALEKTYGLRGFDSTPPIYLSHEIEGSKVYVKFDEGRLGVGPKGPWLEGFEVAGEDRKFYPARARAGKGAVVEVLCDSVQAPVAVRYAFKNCSPISIYNTFGIPASPFRTDDWTE